MNASKVLLSLALLLASAAPASAQIVRWQDIVGIIERGNVVGSGTGAVTGGAPWTTRGGQANVNLRNGHVEFTVQGLVLAVGNSIGTPGAITEVKGTLVCDTDGSASDPDGGGSLTGNSVLVDAPAVPLSPQGDAHFTGFVDAPLPAECLNEPDIAFLIRIQEPAGVRGRWIANGAVRTP